AGNAAYRSGALDDAALALRQALDAARAIGDTSRELAATLGILATVETARKAYPEAEQLHRESLGLWQRAVGPDHENVSAAHNSLALLARAQERWEDAEAHIGRALEIDRRARGSAHPDVAAALSILAGVRR